VNKFQARYLFIDSPEAVKAFSGIKEKSDTEELIIFNSILENFDFYIDTLVNIFLNYVRYFGRVNSRIKGVTVEHINEQILLFVYKKLIKLEKGD
jgi:hypothetical protein